MESSVFMSYQTSVSCMFFGEVRYTQSTFQQFVEYLSSPPLSLMYAICTPGRIGSEVHLVRDRFSARLQIAQPCHRFVLLCLNRLPLA